MKKSIAFPSNAEYPAYADMYMRWCLKDGSLLQQLEDSMSETIQFISSLSKEMLNFRYEKHKWSIKEVLIHIIDDERIYAYRALSFARNDKTVLPGFRQETYIDYADVDTRSIEDIMDEYVAVRKASIALYNSLSKKALLRMGIADGKRASVRALGYHMLGHEKHHLHLVRTLYLGQMIRPYPSMSSYDN